MFSNTGEYVNYFYFGKTKIIDWARARSFCTSFALGFAQGVKNDLFGLVTMAVGLNWSDQFVLLNGFFWRASFRRARC